MTWGANGAGQIGDTTFTDRTVPTVSAAPASPSTMQIDTAGAVVTQSGAGYTWGYGSSYQHGDGTFTARATPTLAFTVPGAWATAAPTFSVAPGSYSGTVIVTIADSTSGATIRYTTDGSTPTESSPEIDVSGQVVLSSTTTLRARAFANGRVPSTVTSGVYVVTP